MPSCRDTPTQGRAGTCTRQESTRGRGRYLRRYFTGSGWWCRSTTDESRLVWSGGERVAVPHYDFAANARAPHGGTEQCFLPGTKASKEAHRGEARVLLLLLLLLLLLVLVWQ